MEILYYENHNLTDVVSPVDAARFQQLLLESNYDAAETAFLVSGFKDGFPLGFAGDRSVQREAPNLKFRRIGNKMIGDKITLWNKVMKEVKLNRYAGPFKTVPFKYFIQSPIGLVPKDNGKDVRLIFHLSYPRGMGTSVNENTPRDLCTIKYPDFAEAIKLCFSLGKGCKIAKSDMKAAFRNLGILPSDYCLLVMKAESPLDGNTYYFVDKCLPFGASISCSHFQRFSNAVAHIVRFRTKKNLVNYLDDYFFADMLKLLCNNQVNTFLKVCHEICFPVSLKKTYWGTTTLTFLGFLIDTLSQLVLVPIEKLDRAINQIDSMLAKKKVTVHQIQKLCGFLNFLGRYIIPGRTFTRRLYAYTAGYLKPHHHIRVNGEMKLDLNTWRTFLTHPTVFARPFMDFIKLSYAEEIGMFSDATANEFLGFGAICGSSWMFNRWNVAFIRRVRPSIEYLELFALVAGCIQWLDRFQNKRVVLFCDNESVCKMVNKSTSTCKQCMVLIRILVLHCLILDVRVFVKHLSSRANRDADLLSRMKIGRFKKINPGKFEGSPTPVPEVLWPMQKLWYF